MCFARWQPPTKFAKLAALSSKTTTSLLAGSGSLLYVGGKPKEEAMRIVSSDGLEAKGLSWLSLSLRPCQAPARPALLTFQP